MELDLDRAAERLRLALDLYQLGEDLMRQQLRRRHPRASAEEVEDLLVAWLHRRPGAEHGDCPRRPRPITLGAKQCHVEQALRRSVQDLESAGAEFALAGGLAVSVWVEPRFTRDVYVAVAVSSDQEAEALTARLVRSGYQILAQVEQEERHRLATVRLLPPGPRSEGLLVDLLFASSGVEPEIVKAAPVVDVLPDLRMRVVRPEHLLALKILASSDQRPQDRSDAVALLAILSIEQRATSRELLALIEKRGFQRGKNLVVELEQLSTSR